MPKPSNGSKKQKQQSLLGFFQSSSPARPSSPEMKHKLHAEPSKSSRRTPKSSPRKGKSKSKYETSSSAGESSDVGAISFEPAVYSLSDSDDDVKKSPRRPIVRKRRVKASRSNSPSPIIIESDSEEENVGVPVTWKGKAKAVPKRKLAVLDSDVEEEAPKRRKLVRGVRPPSPEESDDLIEELDQDKVIEPRFRARGKKSTYLKNLEKLKRKKRGESVQSDSEEVEEDEDNAAPFARARPSNGNDDSASGGEASEEEEDTFIVEDDNKVELPPEWSMSTYQDLTHHFKIVCQLFVHLAVQPPNDRRSFMEESLKSDYFSVPLQVARRKISGMRDSLVASSVWRPDFKKPLETYPHFEIVQLDFAEPGCDACHLGGRLSTRIGRLSGEPYDKLSFQPLSENSDSSDESDSEEEDEKPSLKKEFHLGRFCARRTLVFHHFTHWEYALFEALDDEVQGLRNRLAGRKKGKNVFIPVAYAGGAQAPDDPNDADKIMSWLDERHIIETQWVAVKKMMDDARNLDVAAKRGDDIDD
ncbi:unnamed protein product [Somion occarium]|uniref:DUF4211 domain-containing protein n=1 Tax=Somion occarium TaxID=3059160 RepID=A0ABP1DBH3_9APHY